MPVPVLVWIYVVLPFNQTYVFFNPFIFSLNICRITFCSNSGEEREITGQFEYMSYYLLLKLKRWKIAIFEVWIYVVLPFAQTSNRRSRSFHRLNICRITFCSNLMDVIQLIVGFEYMSYYLLLKLRAAPNVWGKVWIYVVLPFAQTTSLGKRLHINVFKLFFVVKKRQ